MKRRQFLKTSLTASLAFGIPKLMLASEAPNALGSSTEIRLAIIGLGGLNVVGGVGGRGRQLIDRLREVRGAKIVALCEVDKTILDHSVQLFKERGEEVATYTDIRKVLENKAIDAVVIATPNFWHALGTVWACQAGKDVYVEKPFSYNIWEGRQMVAAARKYKRVVQVGTQNRSSTVYRQAFDYLHSGQVGPIRAAHALIYRARDGIGQVSAPTPVPDSINYDLWCGPAPKGPLLRKQLHYEWHWFWATGNGEVGNNGIHMIDVCRCALRQNQSPPRAISIGGRYAFDDCGETPNTNVVFLDYHPAPIICEIRNVRATKTPDALGKYRNRDKGIIIECEGGYFAGDSSGGTVFDNQGQKIKEFQNPEKGSEMENAHLANFLSAVRSRNISELKAEALEGHLSTACCHMANISYRLGKQSSPEAIKEKSQGNSKLIDAFDRCRAYLRANNVDLGATPAVLGPWVTYDARQEQFVQEFAKEANALSRREYREPFVVPNVTA